MALGKLGMDLLGWGESEEVICANDPGGRRTM